MKENCYTCIFKQSIPGNTHVSCTKKDAKPVLNKGAERWMIFPFSIDPIWIEECKDYKDYKANEEV